MKSVRLAFVLLALVLGTWIGSPALSQTFQSLGSASLSVTSTTGNVALPAGKFGGTITILNVGTKEAFIFFGGSTVTAATTNESVPAGSGRCFAVTSQTYVAAITAGSDTTTLRISQGSGPCAVSYRGSAGTIAAGVEVGTTTITGGTDTRVLFDNAGVLGEYVISGTGSVCMTSSCSMTTPALGTPSAVVLTSGTGLPVSTGLTGAGTGVLTALGVNVGSAGAPVLFDGALGTPSSGVATNLTGTAAGLTAGTVTTNANLTGVITSSGNATSIAAQTGTGTTFVVQTSPTLITPAIGVATGTSLALGGATIGSNALAITGTIRQGTVATFGAPLNQFNGANDTVGAVSIGSTDAAAADKGGSLLFTANTTGSAGYPTGAIAGRLVGTSDYRSYVAISATNSAGTVAEKFRIEGETGLATFVGAVVATLASTATTSAVCYNTGTGLLTYNSTVGTCTVSAMRFKTPLPFGDPEGIASLVPARFTYRDPANGVGERLGLYAEDVCRIDEALCIRDADGLVQNYDERGVIALLVAETQYLRSRLNDIAGRGRQHSLRKP